MDRARVVFNHLEVRGAGDHIELVPVSAGEGLSADDVVICSALRTPICRARRGGFKVKIAGPGCAFSLAHDYPKLVPRENEQLSIICTQDTLPDDLLAATFQAVIAETGINPAIIDDICVVGIPDTVPLAVTNRFCSSGLQAAMNIAQAIKAGHIDIGMAGGVESMSLNSMMSIPEGYVMNPKMFENETAAATLIPMGITSENVAERFGISREDQDKMAVDSHAKAVHAQKMGWFKDEVVPVKTILKDADDNETEITISKDDGIRSGTTLEKLGKLKPAFKEGGTTTAGNSSQLSDGAAALILARRSAAAKHGLPVLGRLRGFAVVGVPPDVMGIGPAYAIPAALKNAGMRLADIDVFEINEAFSSQATYCVRKLGIPMEKVNPKGGAIALGHPLGCTGARQIATLLHELKRRGKRGNGVVSMCIGTGMGAAAIFEYPGK